VCCRLQILLLLLIRTKMLDRLHKHTKMQSKRPIKRRKRVSLDQYIFINSCIIAYPFAPVFLLQSVVEFPKCFKSFCTIKLSHIVWKSKLWIFIKQLIALSKIAYNIFTPNKLLKLHLIKCTGISFGLKRWVDNFSFNTTSKYISVPI